MLLNIGNIKLKLIQKFYIIPNFTKTTSTGKRITAVAKPYLKASIQWLIKALFLVLATRSEVTYIYTKSIIEKKILIKSNLILYFIKLNNYTIVLSFRFFFNV